MASLLGSLLDDFDHWFARGEELLGGCSEDQLSDSEQRDLSQRLKKGQQATAGRQLSAKQLAAKKAKLAKVSNTKAGAPAAVEEAPKKKGLFGLF